VARSCDSCGAVAQADNEFCTHCGAKLAAASNVVPLGDTPLPWTSPPKVATSSMRRRSRGLVVALVVVSTACVVLAAATLFSRQELADTQSDLEASQEQVATLEETRVRLVDELAATKGISEKRATVLLRANNVLGGLDPLLASVDALKKDTSEIQAGRSDFQSAADELIRSTITLVNYLVDTDSANADWDYVNDLIDQANGELGTVNSYGTQLSQSDVKYSKDAASFDARATTLSSSVAALKKQLIQVTR
jgi:chromosome segregation ATPase